MRKIALVLVFVLIFGLTGCCYATGFEESDAMQLRLMLPPVWESKTEETEGTVEEILRDPIVLSKAQLDAIAAQPDRADAYMVNVRDYIPDIFVELKYASTDNVAGLIIYNFEDIYLRYGTVKKLMLVQEELRAMGLSLKIWDAYRPASAQFTIWEAFPNATFVTNPNITYADNTYGNAVDITVVDGAGVALEMPTGFDVFTSLADRNYADCTPQAAQNATMLQELMEKHGFRYTHAQWWHYVDTDNYPAETILDPAVVSIWYANCREYINIRTGADASTGSIGTVPANDTFTLLGWDGNFAYIDYNGTRGYVNGDYILPKN